MSATPVAPDEFSKEIAPFGRQGCNAWIVLAELKDELGVLPNRTATVTAARIFAARIRGRRAGKEFRWELRPNV
jgi:hypothetical protein